MDSNKLNKLLIAFAVILFILLISGVIKANILIIAAYLSIIIGIGLFYSSNIKKHLAGVVIGSIIFLSGSVMFVFTKYEIVGLGKIFVPAALFVLGVSLLAGNLLIRINKASLILSILIIMGGVWLVWDKGNANMGLFYSAVFAILKNYWLIIILTAAVIGLISYWFNKRTDKMN
ncbi:MAG TPA: hypothetical protein PK073_08405 [Ignavibacteriaceae bacterium]|jgi:hypothetical protein|nr:MAG: hypothetical protein BWY38_01947 [Ignavibacteria bacterium ADurb.Bin266]OQY74038.1 MAG: hypothetical protein B6D44_05470 [Ignavibacteriales bacterium UTCHB2]HQF42923.1 hypothetical protein [Ignavibacteriaceae bacterium]HQI41732.1 hypothetical protein [Ignavibacteriaceae bacterium]